MPAFAAAPPGATFSTDRAVAILQPELVDRVRRDRTDAHANAPARDLAHAELRQQLADDVDRHRETDADVARPAFADDRRVDADDLTAEVQQRPAGVPGIDRRVGLEHLGVARLRYGERALDRADDPDRHRMRQPERIADRHHPVAREDLARITELHLRERMVRFLGQLDKRAVGQGIAADRPVPRTLASESSPKSDTRIRVAPSTT